MGRNGDGDVVEYLTTSGVYIAFNVDQLLTYSTSYVATPSVL